MELQPAIVVLTPGTQYVRVINDTRTMPPGSITALRLTRDESTSTLFLSGEIASDTAGVVRTVAVRNPSLYVANVIRETLREQGISIEGPPVHYTALDPNSPELIGTQPIFVHRSAPLSEILAAMMKASQNLIAETVLLAVGHQMRGEGSAAAGIAVVDSLLRAWEIPHRQLRMADGSGMSRYDLVSAALLTDVLARMDRTAHRDTWLASLPVAGRDGTLANRMRDPPLIDRVLAKTGTLSGVRTLSGYLTTVRGERIVFSIIVNNHMQGAAAADRVAEEALRLIAESR
jgi:D-alanyl-D-alanine carboxypeptidase/D-alanyl-D-alanine-endopeptidase (penicillin-binding protein 4)